MSPLRVFVVEDEPDIQKLLRMSLEMLGKYEVEIYSDGEVALETIEAFDPDIILLDVMMPKMTGPEILEQIKKMEALIHTPVVFITARVRSQDIAEYRAMGVDDVISKPFNAVELPKKLQEIVDTAMEELAALLR